MEHHQDNHVKEASPLAWATDKTENPREPTPIIRTTFSFLKKLSLFLTVCSQYNSSSTGRWQLCRVTLPHSRTQTHACGTASRGSSLCTVCTLLQSVQWNYWKFIDAPPRRSHDWFWGTIGSSKNRAKEEWISQWPRRSTMLSEASKSLGEWAFPVLL